MRGFFNGMAGRLRACALAGLSAVSTLAASVPVLAQYVEPDPDNVFDSLTNSNTSVDQAGNTFLGIFRSAYSVIVTLGIILIAIGIILTVIRMIISSNSNTRETAKNDLLRIIIAAVGLGAVLIIISLMLSIGNSF